MCLCVSLIISRLSPLALSLSRSRPLCPSLHSSCQWAAVECARRWRPAAASCVSEKQVSLRLSFMCQLLSSLARSHFQPAMIIIIQSAAAPWPRARLLLCRLRVCASVCVCARATRPIALGRSNWAE